MGARLCAAIRRGAARGGDLRRRRRPPTLRPVLHVTNGDSAVAGLREAGVGGDVLAWRDTLHEGPVPAGLDEKELRATRARFLAAQGWAAEEEARAHMEARDARLARAIAGAEELVLWFETDLYDMLQLAQILDRVPPDAASLVIVGEQEFAGVGELEPRALRALFEGGGGQGRRVAVDAVLCDAGRAVWAALPRARSDGPRARRRHSGAARARRCGPAPPAAVPLARVEPQPDRARAADGGPRRRANARGGVPRPAAPRGAAVHGRFDGVRLSGRARRRTGSAAAGPRRARAQRSRRGRARRRAGWEGRPSAGSAAYGCPRARRPGRGIPWPAGSPERARAAAPARRPPARRRHPCLIPSSAAPARPPRTPLRQSAASAASIRPISRRARLRQRLVEVAALRRLHAGRAAASRTGTRRSAGGRRRRARRRRGSRGG